jgi:hypothetical protein
MSCEREARSARRGERLCRSASTASRCFASRDSAFRLLNSGSATALLNRADSRSHFPFCAAPHFVSLSGPR